MKMKNTFALILATAGILFLNGCKKEDTDQQKPVIDVGFADAFPQNCDTLYFGESFNVKALFTDNVELGSFSIEIHHNFDHHSHSTEVTTCQLDPKKDPVNPFVFIKDYPIGEGLNRYETNLAISIPSGVGCCPYDEGDYHFFISLTDKAGWSTQKGLNIKIRQR